MCFEHFFLVMLVALLGHLLSILCPLQPDHAAVVNWACVRAQLRDFDTGIYFWKTWCWTNLPRSNLLLHLILPVPWQRLVKKREWVGFKASLWGCWGRGAATGGVKGEGMACELLCPTCKYPSQELILENGWHFFGFLISRVRRSREELRFYLGTGPWKWMLRDGQQMLWSSGPLEALSSGLLLL